MWNIWSFYELDVPWFLTFYHVSRYIYILVQIMHSKAFLGCDPSHLKIFNLNTNKPG